MDARLPPAADYSALIAPHGTEFVRLAYVTLLDREPDESGLAHYLAALRAGEPKVQLLRELRDSEEASRVGRDVAGLNEAIQKFDRPATGFFGAPRRRGVEGNGIADRRLRSIEQAVYDLQRSIMVRLDAIEAQLEVLKAAPRADGMGTEPVAAAPSSVVSQIEFGSVAGEVRIIADMTARLRAN